MQEVNNKNLRAANITITTANLSASSNSDWKEQKKNGDKKRKEAQTKLGQFYEEKDVLIKDGTITHI